MFSSYKKMLETSPAHHPKTKCKIAFLTGLSNPKSCALSKAQKKFLAALELPEFYKLYLNFPYMPSEGEENEPLWKASLHNAQQFLNTNSLRVLIQSHLTQLASTTDSLIFITGSCGLELLNVGLSDKAIKKVLHVYALGPVAWQKHNYPCTLIRGSSDHISKLFFGKVDSQPSDVNHMNYLESKEVFDFINNHAQQLSTISSRKSLQTT
jgi:hypothetical protein